MAGPLTTSAVVSIALAWSGWLLLEQQRDLDSRLATDRTEAAATAMAASIREKLAELGDQLAAGLTAPASSPGVPAATTLPGLVTVIQRSQNLEVQPDGTLPFVPAHPAPVQHRRCSPLARRPSSRRNRSRPRLTLTRG